VEELSNDFRPTHLPKTIKDREVIGSKRRLIPEDRMDRVDEDSVLEKSTTSSTTTTTTTTTYNSTISDKEPYKFRKRAALTKSVQQKPQFVKNTLTPTDLAKSSMDDLLNAIEDTHARIKSWQISMV